MYYTIQVVFFHEQVLIFNLFSHLSTVVCIYKIVQDSNPLKIFFGVYISMLGS